MADRKNDISKQTPEKPSKNDVNQHTQSSARKTNLRPSVRRFSAKPEKEHSTLIDPFTLSFTSLSIILLSFFIFLNSLARPDIVRKHQVLGSLAKHFVKGPQPEAKVIPEHTNLRDMPIPELALGFPKLSFSTKYSSVADAAEAGQLQVERHENRFVIVLPGADLFASGDDRLGASYLPVLRRIAAQIVKNRLFVEIEGHTDNLPISSKRFPSNWELSAARAVSVLRFFLDQGISSTRLSAAGRAEFKPVASNETEEGRAKNRRVILIIKEPSPQNRARRS